MSRKFISSTNHVENWMTIFLKSITVLMCLQGLVFLLYLLYKVNGILKEIYLINTNKRKTFKNNKYEDTAETSQVLRTMFSSSSTTISTAISCGYIF